MSGSITPARGSAGVLVLLALALSPAVAAAQPHGEEALRAKAAELLPRVEALSGLRARRPVQIASRTRDQLRAHLEAQRQNVDSAEIAAVEAVYRRLRLLPDGGGAADGSLELYAEQIVGYYDSRTDTLYVLEDVPAAQVIPVLVHEMVHALQNQHVALDSLIARSRGGDRQLAARAAIEGHATVTTWLFSAERSSGRPARVTDLPDMSLIALELLLPDDPPPMLEAAPVLVREEFIFPYSRGAGFVQALWRHDPAALPFHSLLPQSTEQVLDPVRRFLDGRDPPTEIIFPGLAVGTTPADEAGPHPAGRAALGGWTPLYENTLGQFELSVLLKLRHYQVGAEKHAIGWAGDRYLLMEKDGVRALVWYLVWDDRRSAASFASAYRQILGGRLNKDGVVEEVTIDGRSVVRIIEADDGVDIASVPRPRVSLASERDEP